MNFKPTPDEVRAERERTGIDLYTCRKRLKQEKMIYALNCIDEDDLNHHQTVMLAVLKELVDPS